jgi:hypothetical protein
MFHLFLLFYTACFLLVKIRVNFLITGKLLNNLKLQQVPSPCLKQLMMELFPAPMHLRAEGPLPSNHFLHNNPDTFI